MTQGGWPQGHGVGHAHHQQRSDEPTEKPWWWQGLMVIFGLSGMSANTLGLFSITEELPHPLVPISGLLAGMLVLIAIVGHRPGRYRYFETDEKVTLWKRLGPLARVGMFFGTFAVAISGCVLSLLE